MQQLSAEQIGHYERHGFLVVSGLIPDSVSRAAERAMWDLLGKDPDDTATWEPHPPFSENFESPALLATYTAELLAAARELAAVGRNREGTLPPFDVPKHAHCLNRFPESGVEWQHPGLHVDHSIREHGHMTFPRAYRIAAMTYLNDCAPHGGNTFVWPEAYHRIWDEVETNRARYAEMWQVGELVKTMDLGPAVELVPKRGDVLFYDVMCAHAGSMNTADRPRFALNWKW